MNRYMHTLDGKPAFYDPREKMIFFCGQTRIGGEYLVNSLKTIRHQQSMSRATRIKGGFNNGSDDFKYGYLLIQDIEYALDWKKIAEMVQVHLQEYDGREIDQGVAQSEKFAGDLALFLGEVRI